MNTEFNNFALTDFKRRQCKKFKYTDEKDHSYEYRVKYDYSFTNVNGKDETWHMTVILNNKEGKWYLDMVK